MNFKLRNLVITAAILLPFGLVALGIWKGYELYKGKKEDEKTTKSE